MARRWYGRIVAISSGAGRGGMANPGHYGASEWGLIGSVKTVAIETARQGITAVDGPEGDRDLRGPVPRSSRSSTAA